MQTLLFSLLQKRNRTYLPIAIFILLIASTHAGCRFAVGEDTGVAAQPTAYSLELDLTETPLPITPSPKIISPALATQNDQKKFSIVWIADTQTIAYHGDNDVFEAMGKWIVKQKEPINIQYIVQTGDLVDNGYSPKQWANFEVMSREFFGKIPYLPVAGNHDLGVKWEKYAAYLQIPYVKAIPVERKFKHGQAVFAEFHAGGQDFLIVGAGWNADVSSVVWINNVLKTHPNHIAILLFHSYINAKGELSHQGLPLRNLIVAKNPNVRLVLSGHLRGNGYLQDLFDDDADGIAERSVNAMLYNYQGYAHANSGQIRVLTFDPQTRTIHVVTYSPYSDRYYKDDYFDRAEFDLEAAF